MLISQNNSKESTLKKKRLETLWHHPYNKKTQHKTRFWLRAIERETVLSLLFSFFIHLRSEREREREKNKCDMWIKKIKKRWNPKQKISKKSCPKFNTFCTQTDTYTTNNNERWKLRQSFPGHHGCLRTPVFVGPEENRAFFWWYFYSLSSFLGDIVYSKSDRLFPPWLLRGIGETKGDKTDITHLSLSLNSHFDDDIRIHTNTWTALYAARRPLRLPGVRCCCRFLVRIRFFLFLDWVFGLKHLVEGK